MSLEKGRILQQVLKEYHAVSVPISVALLSLLRLEIMHRGSVSSIGNSHFIKNKKGANARAKNTCIQNTCS